METGEEQMPGTMGSARHNVLVALKVARPALIVVSVLSAVGVLFGAIDAARQRPWIVFIMTCVLTLVMLVTLTVARRWNRAAWLPVLPFAMVVLAFIVELEGVVTWGVVAIVVAAAIHGQCVEKRARSEGE
jgi:hypothetical protein